MEGYRGRQVQAGFDITLGSVSRTARVLVAESLIGVTGRKQPQYIEQGTQIAVSPIPALLAAFFQVLLFGYTLRSLM